MQGSFQLIISRPLVNTPIDQLDGCSAGTELLEIVSCTSLKTRWLMPLQELHLFPKPHLKMECMLLWHRHSAKSVQFTAAACGSHSCIDSLQTQTKAT